ncbi:hypothetical protein U9M48_031550 [Paspalum notatum var. saurae]|uniref:Uncharacterized protein n=1 Tax=Paspalum notatum var. saurae TaxID=547442 RepID=A0AAQ3U2T1_PASNO
MYKPLSLPINLVFVYGDPHHSRTTSIWQDNYHFVVQYSDLNLILLIGIGCLISAILSNNVVSLTWVTTLLERKFSHTAKQCWLRSASIPFHLKTTYLASNLKVWIKKKPKITEHLQQIENHILIE